MFYSQGNVFTNRLGVIMGAGDCSGLCRELYAGGIVIEHKTQRDIVSKRSQSRTNLANVSQHCREERKGDKRAEDDAGEEGR